MTPLRAFGKQVARAQDEALLGSQEASEARERFLAMATVPARRGQVWGSWAAVAAMVAAAGLVALWPVRRPSLGFDVGPSEAAAQGTRRERGTLGEWIAAPAGDRLPIHFSDGSMLRLASSSRARVVAITNEGARVVLERGEVWAEVVHRKETRWVVQAGPFEVHVRGTVFSVVWDPVREDFEVTLEQGSVSVSGCSLDGERMVSRGKTFRAACKDGKAVLPETTAASTTPLEDSARATEAVPARTATGTATGPTPSDAISIAPRSLEDPSQGTAASTPPDWHALFLAGRYREAIDVADSMGLTSVCEAADAARLIDLSDAARFAGHRDDAELVLLAVRRRFPGSERGSVAAFHLGRIAFDDLGAYADGARWFETYLRESPDGALAREASGRLIEALERSGDHAAAKSAAQRYLLAYPKGPHAELARGLSER
jgi:transmembrane sensor